MGKKVAQPRGRREVIEGYRKLAFGPGNDTLKLLFFDERPCWEELEHLDIFNISEISRPKGGGMTIKFYDRVDAIERLIDIGNLAQVPEGVKMFYEAIEKSVDKEEEVKEDAGGNSQVFEKTVEGDELVVEGQRT